MDERERRLLLDDLEERLNDALLAMIDQGITADEARAAFEAALADALHWRKQTEAER